ncbi:MAG: uroporphyrinogen decarboxylase family protein [Thermoleophilia bacterium]
MFTENWSELTPDERFDVRMQAWMEPGVEFASPGVRQAYQERVQLFRDAIELKKPARVPVAPWIGLFPGLNAGLTARETYYEYEKLHGAWQTFHDEFRPDVLAFSINIVPTRLYDILDYHLYDWPGHGVPEDAGYQYNEKEWMRDDEYDLLINDPSNYWQRFYLPRVIGALEPWTTLAPFTDLVEGPFTGPFFIPFGTPPVQQMLKTMLDAGNAALEWVQAMAGMDGASTAAFGIPGFAGGATKAPYDTLGDTMRGTRGLMLDKFRRPEKVLEACERLVPLAIDWGVRAADVNRHPMVFIPLHKGADGFLSDEDFRTFYWPTLKKVLLGLIEQGVVPLCFAEGGYNERLAAIHDPEIPAGRMIWMFDATDMKAAREHLGGYQCFGGNVPGALLTTGTAAETEAYVKQLIADVAGPGGFILGSGIVIDEARADCMKAMIDAGRRYGSEI